MRISISLLSIYVLFAACGAVKNQSAEINQIVNASCGICNFEMTGDDCALAVCIESKYYYVEGSEINAHGDAHAEDGLCSTIRKASVSGQIKNGVFVAKTFQLLAK